MDLLELAARCEAAEGADRELDARIWCVIGVGSPWTAENCWLAATVRPPELESLGLTLGQWLDKWPEEADAAARNYNVPEFTASLDAAMTLVPEAHLQPSDIVREALSSLGKRFGLHMMHWPLLTPFTEYLARHVCAAALRARAASGMSAGTAETRSGSGPQDRQPDPKGDAHPLPPSEEPLT